MGRRGLSRRVRGAGFEARRMAREGRGPAARSGPRHAHRSRRGRDAARHAACADAARHGALAAMKRRDLIKAGPVVLLLGTAQIARGATIVAVRVWPAPEYSRVTIESDAQLRTTQTLLSSPPRLAVDIHGLELSPELRELVGKVRSDDPFIGGVRASQHQPRVVRMVLDLKQPAVPQVFTLQPIAAYQHRLVFDFYPVTTIDPLEALINERLKDRP